MEEKSNKLCIVVIVLIVITLCEVGFIMVRYVFNKTEETIIYDGEIEEDMGEEKFVVDIKENEIIATESKTIKLNGKEKTISLKYYVLKEKDEEIGQIFYNLYYDIYLNDKLVSDANKNNVYYDECEYIDDDTDDCSITSERLATYASSLIELKKMVDDNKKEYVTVRLNGGGPQDSEKLYVIDDSGKVILKMYIDESCGLDKLLGKGKEKYQDEDVYLWYKINNDVINYLEIDSDDYSEEEGYYINDKTKVISHEITIEDGKIVDKKTNEVFTTSEISGATITFGVSIKTY